MPGAELPRGITARGNSVLLSFTYRGQRCRETIRVKPTKTLIRELERKRAAILYEIDTGTFDYAKHFPYSKNALKFGKNKGSLVTVQTKLEAWLERASLRCQPSTMEGYYKAVVNQLIPHFGKLTLDMLTLDAIYEWVGMQSCSNKRINNVLSPLRQMCRDAYYEGLIDHNPFDRFRNLPVETREPKPFSKAEVQRILDQLHGHELNLIDFAFHSGLRTSELIGLGWEDVDLTRNIVHIRRALVNGKEKTTKTQSGLRTIELTDRAKNALIRQQKLCTINKVFLDPQSNKAWKSDGVIRKRVWIPALSRARIDYRNPYQTRHTFASQMLMDGADPFWLARQMGHRDWGMIRKIYGRWIPSIS